MKQKSTNTYEATETIYTMPDVNGEYRIVTRSDSRFMDVEYRRGSSEFFHSPWERINSTDQTIKAQSSIEAHAERMREQS